MKENSYLGRFIEPFIVFIIIIAIFQTFFEEYATFSYMSRHIRLLSLLAGFAIDAIFSIEFLARLFVSAKKRAASTYFAKEGGFIDFLSSFPLLILNSGPLVYVTFFAGKAGIISTIGMFSFFKIVKIVRIARTFRFLRTLKIFYRFRKRYVMTSKYISGIAGIVIAVVLLTLIGYSFIDKGTVITSNSTVMEKVLSSYLTNKKGGDFDNLLKNTDSVLFIKDNKKIIYQKISLTDFNKSFFNDDYYKRKIGKYIVYFNNKDRKKILSFINMMAYTTILGIILLLAIPYRHLFNKHITSILSTMIKGFKKSSYMTPVRIDTKRLYLESYQLAQQYNKKWLPVKRKILELKSRI